MNVLGFKLFDFSFYGNTNFLFFHFFFFIFFVFERNIDHLVDIINTIDNVRYIISM